MMKKIIIALLVVLVVFAATLITVPILFKDKITAAVKTAINEQVNAKVNWSAVEVTILPNFPNLTLCLNDLNVTCLAPFEGDTLAAAQELEITLDLMSVIKGGTVSIRSVSLNKALVNLLVLKDGRVNWDITKPAPEAQAGASDAYHIALKSYRLDHSQIRYNDQSLGFKMLLQDVNHTGSGDFNQDLFTLATKTAVERCYVWYGGINYLNKVKADWKADLEIDNKNSKYTFKENELLLNDLAIGFEGFVAMPATDVSVDMKFKSAKAAFSSLVSLIPGIYQNDFKNLKSSGTFAFEGFTKGVYNDHSMPAYGITLNVQQGMFQYPSLPAAVKNVALDLKVSNPDGITDHTIIDLKKLHVEMGGDPFDAHMYVVTPVSDVNIDAAMKGKINLGNIKNIVPLEKGTNLSGMLLADVAVKGRMSSIEKKQYENFDASGTMAISGMSYKSDAYPNGILVDQFLLSFNPRNVILSKCNMKFGKSDLNASGTLDNLLGYYLKNDVLSGSLSINSTLLDLNEMMNGSSEAQASDTGAMQVITVPESIRFDLTAAVAKILYEDKVIENLTGKLSLHEGIADMTGLTFNMLDGTVNMNGRYATTDVKQPDFNLNLALSDFDIQKTSKAFTTVQQMAPIAEHCTGKVSTSFNAAGKLDEHMEPQLNTLQGGGTLKTSNIILSNFEPASKLADALKMPQYKQMVLQDLNFSYKFINGRVAVAPFETNLAGTKATIEGSNGFDETIDYHIDLSIPKSQLGAQANGVMNNLFAGVNKTAGTNISLPDPVNIKVAVGGTVSNPVIKTGLKDAATNMTETVKEEVQAAVEEKIDEGKAAAKAQADKLISDAEAKAKELRDAAVITADNIKKQGYANADKLVEQAKDPVSKAGAKIAADKLKKETDAKAAQIIKAADDEGKKLIDEARKQSDALLK